MEYITSQLYVLCFMFMVLITTMMKHHNIFISAFYPILIRLPDKILTVVTCMICGVLPVPGRIMVTNMCLDCSCKTNNKLGLLSYIVSHHYYMWSPVEKTILLPIAVLGFTYSDVISYMCVPLLIYIVYMVFIIYNHNISTTAKLHFSTRFAWVDMMLLVCGLILSSICSDLMLFDVKIPTLLLLTLGFFVYLCVRYKTDRDLLIQSISYKSLIVLSILMFIGTYIKQHADHLTDYTASTDIWMVCVLSFLISLAMGSSGKFAGVCVATTSVFGVEYFTLFFMVDYVGYLLSPFHKCLPIAVMNFDTPVKTMLYTLAPLCVLLLLYGVFSVTV